MVKRKAQEIGSAPVKSAATAGDINGLDDEESFPRGGNSILSDLEKREIQQAAIADFERDQKQDKEKDYSDRIRKKKRKVETSDKVVQQEFTGKTPKSVGILTFKSLSPGFKLLGVVSEVTPSDVIISLPNGLKAYAKTRAKKVDQVTKLKLQPGQLVVCVVISLKSGPVKPRINVSCDPAIVNKNLGLSYLAKGLTIPVTVTSHEDHGYIVDTGPSGKHFISEEKLKNNEEPISAGDIRFCNVTFVNLNKKAVGLEFAPESFPDAILSSNVNITLQSLQPGTAIIGEIKQVLRDGLMVQFLTYFTGYCDRWHLSGDVLASDMLSKYKVNEKVEARVLYVDNARKRVGLTMKSSLLLLKSPDMAPKFGKILDTNVERVDGNSGVMLGIMRNSDAFQYGESAVIPAYCNTADATDNKSTNLNKQFHVGQSVKARVIGNRALDGVVIVSLKTSVVNQSVFDITECHPGQLISAKIVKVEDDSLSMSVTESIKAICRLSHMAEVPISKTPKKFKSGQEVKCRILKIDKPRKCVHVSLKRTLVNSKLPCIVTFNDAKVGLKVHGFISAIEAYGLFVDFYGGIRGLVHKSNLGISSSEDIETAFTVGQVVKSIVIGVDEGKKQINLSLNISKDPSDNLFQKTTLGMKVKCTVKSKTPSGILAVVDTNRIQNKTAGSTSPVQAFIPMEHLSDNIRLNEKILEALEEGSELSETIVLAKNDSKRMLVLSAKTSLVSVADDRQKLPEDIGTVSEGHLLYGYVASVTKGAVFVRFLGKFSALAPLSQLMDSYVSDPGQHFKIGQSVKALVTSIDEASSRCKVSLKPSLCGSENGKIGFDYFSTISWILQMKGLRKMRVPNISQNITGSVAEVKDYGLIVEIDGFEGIVGFVVSHQIGSAKLGVGDKIAGYVLDVSYAEGIVDLSLAVKKSTKAKQKKNETNAKGERDSSKFSQGQHVDAVIELVKEDYLVLSLSQSSHCVGFIVNTDTNTSFKNIHDNFKVGMKLKPHFHSTYRSEYMNRQILALDLTKREEKTNADGPKWGLARSLVGSVIKGKVKEIKPLFAEIETESGLKGQIHVMSMDLSQHVGKFPLQSLEKNKDMEFNVLGEVRRKKGESNRGRTGQLLLSLKQQNNLQPAEANHSSPSFEDITTGIEVLGVIAKIDTDRLSIQLSKKLRGSLSVFELSTDLDQVLHIHEQFKVGQAVKCKVLNKNAGKKFIDLTMIDRPVDASSWAGTIVIGKVSKILKGEGLSIQIRPNVYGRCFITDISDYYSEDNDIPVGTTVRAYIKSVEGSKIDVSLRDSRGGGIAIDRQADPGHYMAEISSIDQLKEGEIVWGFVKSCSEKGCFVSLGRRIDGRVLLSRLSDKFIASPAETFFPGKLVQAIVLQVDTNQRTIELSLRKSDVSGKMESSKKARTFSVADFVVGEIVEGTVRRVESYGLFINLKQNSVVGKISRLGVPATVLETYTPWSAPTMCSGLCHISEVSDTFTKDLAPLYKVDQKVVVKIIAIDAESSRVSLTMKASALKDEKIDGVDSEDDSMEVQKRAIAGSLDVQMESADESLSEGSPSDIENEDENLEAMQIDELSENSDDELDNDGLGEEKGEKLNLSNPADDIKLLNITADAIWESDQEIVSIADNDQINETATVSKSKKKREKAKRIREREAQIRENEARQLEDDAAPATSEDFEKLVLSNPNSSYIWIRYAALLLSQSEIEKARAIFERALTTVHFREESEKLNLWVAYLNFENMHGDPSGPEAVLRVFQRAIQVSDSKKLHIALLNLYERTEQTSEAETLIRMLQKRFRESCKMWLLSIEFHLKSGNGGNARSCLERGLQALPNRKHLKLILKAGILEFKLGSPERARVILEGVLQNYPKRTDIWSIYIDQEARLGELEHCRSLFERATRSNEIPAKKMKFIFKKYLTFEEEHGDETTVESVKQKAIAYIQGKMGVD